MYLSGHDALETTQIFSANKRNCRTSAFFRPSEERYSDSRKSTIPMGGRAVFR